MLAIILALGVQVSYANPWVSGAELRAMSCCADHNGAPMPLPAARTCCGVTAAQSGPAEGPVASAAPALVPVGLVGPVSWPAAAGSRRAVHEMSPAGTGPPPFLEHLHLLI